MQNGELLHASFGSSEPPLSPAHHRGTGPEEHGQAFFSQADCVEPWQFEDFGLIVNVLGSFGYAEP